MPLINNNEIQTNNEIKTNKRHMVVETHYQEIGNKCNHDINDQENTLTKLPKRLMVYPQKFDYFCKCCSQTFTFVQNDKGELNLAGL